MRIGGTFDYRDTTRSFTIELAMSQVLSYENREGPFDVSPGDTAGLIVVLDATKWLDSVNLRNCLDNGFIPLEPNGDLRIEERMGAGPCKGVEAAIRVSVITSGRLRVR